MATKPFNQHSKLSEDSKYGMIGTMGPYQEFFEEGVGDTTAGSRMAGTLTKGKLFEPPSSGFGSKYAAENIPILKDMDRISRGVYNAIAPYGEKAFDILDTLMRVPGAGSADIANMFGVEEDDINEIQASVNTAIGMMVPQSNPVMTAATTNQALGSVIKATKELKNTAKYTPELISGEMSLFGGPKAQSVGAAVTNSNLTHLQKQRNISKLALENGYRRNGSTGKWYPVEMLEPNKQGKWVVKDKTIGGDNIIDVKLDPNGIPISHKLIPRVDKVGRVIHRDREGKIIGYIKKENLEHGGGTGNYKRTEKDLEHIKQLHVKLQVDNVKQNEIYLDKINSFFKLNPDLKDVSKVNNNVVTHIQDFLGTAELGTSKGSRIGGPRLRTMLEDMGLYKKIGGHIDAATKQQVKNYLLKNDNWKTLSTKQVLEDLNLQDKIAEPTLMSWRRKGFDDGIKLVPISKERKSLQDARRKYGSMMREKYGSVLSEAERNKLTMAFSDYLGDAYGVERKQGYTQNQIDEAFKFVEDTELGMNTVEGRAYQEMHQANQLYNNQKLAEINAERATKGLKPLNQNSEEVADVMLTMGHARLNPATGKMGAFDLAKVEPETKAKNKLALNKGRQLQAAIKQDNLPAVDRVITEMIEAGIRHEVVLPGRKFKGVKEAEGLVDTIDDTFVIGGEAPEAFPYELMADGGKFAEGGKLTGKEYQHFFEEGVGDKVGSLRTLGTLWKGRLLTGASSGFGNEYAAENLPILKDMDPLSRGIWNTIAPYGEKAFDVVDTLFRLPGSFVADTFEGFGVDEDKANKLQAEINTMLAMPVAGGPTSAAGRMKSLKTVSDTAKKLKNVEKSSDNIIGPMPLGEVVNMPQPLGKAKEVGLGFKSKLNPNTKKLELYQEGELVGSFDSIADAQSTMKKINAGKWKGKADYKTTKSKISQGWEIRFPGQTNTMNFKTKKEAQQYIKDNYPDVPPNITVHKVDKGTVVIKDKKGDFSRYSLMFEDIQTNYSPKEIKTASQWIGELKNRGHTKELDKGGFGYTLFKKGNEKLSAEDLFKLRKEKGSQLNTETIRMGTTDTINLLGEFDSIHIQYVDSLVPMGGVTARNPAFQHAFQTRWGSLPGKTQKYIKDKVDNFATYYKNFLERNDGRLTATQDNVLNGRIDKVLAEITIAAEKAGGGNAWAPKLADFNAPNFSSNVLQAAGDVLTKTQMGSASRRFLTDLKNLRRDYGVTRSHANLTLPGKAQKTHRTDVYTYNPIKGQVNTSDVVTTHMGQRNELAHVRKTDRSSLDGQNGVLLDEIQFDVLKNVAKNDKAVFKAETMGGQADALAEQVKTLEAQRARIKNLELKKLIVKSDIEPVMDYNLPRNQRALIEEAKTIPDDSPMMAEIINKIEQEGDVGDWLMNNSKAYAKIENELARIEKEFSGTVTAKTGMPDIPFRQHEEMLGEIFKIEIGKAVENNKDFVAIPLPEVVFGYESASGGNMAIAFNNIYRKNSLRALKTLQENYKKRLESLGIDGEAFKITSGDDVNIWLSWDKNSSTSDGFMSKINAMKREHGIDNAEEFYKKLNSGQIDRNQMPLLPFEIGEMPGGKIAVKPGIVIDLRNMNGFDRKQLAKIGFKEYKEGGSTNINKYSALAGIDILGVAI